MRRYSQRNNLSSLSEINITPLLDLAFAWLLAFPVIPSVIAGATRPEQIKANVAAGQWTLTPAERDDVTALVS